MEEDILEEILSVLKDIEKWVRITSIPAVKEILVNTLTAQEARKVYHYSDGRNQTEIAKLVGISQPTVSNYWNKWAKLGIVHESLKHKGRWEKSLLLEDFDLPLE